MDMDDDDEFGDLYTDVLRPLSSNLHPSVSNPSPNPASITGSDVTPVENPNSDRPIDALALASGEDVKEDWLPDNWNDDGDDIPVANFSRNVEPKVLGVWHGARTSGSVAGDAGLLVVEELRVSEEDENIKIADLDQEPVIPGISIAPLSSNAGMRVSNSEDWDSDSEDDLQIVLNDNSHGPRIGERNVEDEDDEDGEEDLVIVTDQDQQHHHHPVMEEQEWAEGELQPVAEGERKDNSDAAKANGAVGNTAGPTRTGYNIHGFNPQHHSMFKYVRPGAPVAGAITPSQIRPPSTVGSVAGRGRGDWRPPGIRPGAPKNYHSGYAPGWANSSSRPFGGSLDFTLPSHKTVFDVDIESFEEKPWKYPGVDISDYFNFGLDEENWKEYCKQLDQLRVESTMQSKIRVYESGRSEQEYDPDLPPELAAATGHHDISSDMMHHVRIDNGQSDLSGQGRGVPFIRAPFPPGRAIQVETSYGERLPSIDTRPPRTRDADAIIEIVLQDPMNDSLIHNGAGDQTEKDTQEEHRKDIHDAEGDRTESDYSNRCPQTSNGRPRKVGSRRIPYASEGDDTLQFPPDSPPHYHPNTTQSPIDRAGSFSSHRGGRLTEGSSRGRYSSVGGKHSNCNNMIPAQSAEANQDGDDSDDRSSNSTEHNRTPRPSSPIEAENAGDLSLEQRDGEREDMLALGDNIDVEETSEFRISGETFGEDSMIQYPKKQKLSSRVEQAIVQDDGDDDDLRATHSESSRAKSGSSNRKQRESDDEEVQGGRSRRAGDMRRRHEEKEPTFRRKDDYGREGKYEMERNRLSSRGHEPIYNSYTHKDQKFSSRSIQGRSEGLERPRETDCSLWQRKEDIIHSRRIKDEDIRLGREDVIHNRRIKDEGIRREETGSRNRSKFRVADRDDGALLKKRLLDDGDWRGRSREGGPRLRERDDVLSRGEISMDEHQVKRRRNEEEHLKMDRASREDSLHSSYKAKEESSRRKRERDDYADPRREDSSRVRDKAMADDHHSSKHKDESWRQREKDDKQWLKQTLEDSPLRREREEVLGAGARNKSDPKVLIPDKDFQRRDRGRHTDHLKRRDRDRVREEKYPQLKGREGVDAREKHYSNEERTSRQLRLSTHSDRVSTASDNQLISRERHSGEIRKGKDTEVSGQNTTGHGRRKHEEFNSHRNEKVSSERTHSKNVNEDPAHSPEKQEEEEVASDDESKRGRSKLERWTSHKERDYNFSAEDNNSLRSASSSRAKAEEVEAGDTGNVLTKTEANDGSDSDVKGAAGDGGQIAERSEEDDRGGDRNLDTFAKLKRRSERFKLPMPVDKDVVALGKRSENEAVAVQLTQNEAPADAEAEAIKPERPARKRRWTSS